MKNWIYKRALFNPLEFDHRGKVMEHETLSRGTKFDPTLEKAVFHKVKPHPLYPLGKHCIYLFLSGFFFISLPCQVK
ncbi:MAG: hypothetical protein KAJ08_12655, partial [Deltaproteobacteria bacterium]|nr:hypothetical protein [Deltaproteobacteria bacterium]